MLCEASPVAFTYDACSGWIERSTFSDSDLKPKKYAVIDIMRTILIGCKTNKSAEKDTSTDESHSLEISFPHCKLKKNVNVADEATVRKLRNQAMYRK